MRVTINAKRYDTDSATLLASDRYWDGHNHERGGRNCYLYRTARGAYFAHHTSLWQGERDTIVPLDLAQAQDLWEDLPERETEYDEAFPGAVVEDA